MCLTVPMNENYISISLGEMSLSALIDTGANISCITENALRKSQLRHLQFQPNDIQNIVSVSGDFTPVKAIVTIP